MRYYTFFAAAVASVFAGQAQAVTYYHFTIDFSTFNMISTITGASGSYNTATHIVANFQSDPSQPYYYSELDLLFFHTDNGDVTLYYDPAALSASTAASPISTDMTVRVDPGRGQVIVPYGFYNSAYASSTPTGPLGVTTSGAFSPTPEPSVWAMTIVGFGFVGFALRDRRARARVSFA